MRSAIVTLNGVELKLAVVFGLKQARDLAEKVRAGKADFDLIEVMACPGGCIGGAGQPVQRDMHEARRQRTKALYDVDKTLDLHKSQDNLYVNECYEKHLGQVNGHKAHELLHTHYQARRRITGQQIALGNGNGHAQAEKLKVNVCVGTSCFLRGSQGVLQGLMKHVEDNVLQDQVEIGGTFCHEQCQQGPTVTIGKTLLHKCNLDDALAVLKKEIDAKAAPADAPEAK